MGKIVRTLMVGIAALSIAGSAMAAQAKPATKATHAAKATATTGTATVARGKIVKFDPASKMLTLSTGSGEEQFTLAANARVREGSKSVTAADLEKMAGDRATVRYSESGGQRTAHSVTLAHKTATKSPKKH